MGHPSTAGIHGVNIKGGAIHLWKSIRCPARRGPQHPWSTRAGLWRNRGSEVVGTTSSTTWPSPQSIVCSYHKTGTSLFFHVVTGVARRLGLTLLNCYGMVDEIDPEPDIVLVAHWLLRKPPRRPYRAIRLIRDPRDIWVSGYLYHLRCDEEWRVNTDLSRPGPIGWPAVDYSILHYPKAEKRAWLSRLDGASYQKNLRDRSTEDGLLFELRDYTRNTLEAMPPGIALTLTRWMCVWKTRWRTLTAQCGASLSISASLPRTWKPRMMSRALRT